MKQTLEKYKESGYNVNYSTLTTPWGRFGLDRMFGENRLRVRALFPLINEQNKLNANNDNVIVGRFGADRALLAA